MPSVVAPPITHEPAEQYHAKAGEFLSSHLLAEFRKSPLLYYRKRFGFTVEEDKNRPAFVLGRAAHTLILEGLDVFDETYEVGGPINPRTGQPFGSGTKAWSEWAESHGKDVLTVEQFELISRMSQAVNTHPVASGLLEDGVAEGVVRADYCNGGRVVGRLTRMTAADRP
jgi:hypothetical protein